MANAGYYDKETMTNAIFVVGLYFIKFVTIHKGIKKYEIYENWNKKKQMATFKNVVPVFVKENIRHNSLSQNQAPNNPSNLKQ